MVGQMTYLLHLHYGDWQHDTLTFQVSCPSAAMAAERITSARGED